MLARSLAVYDVLSQVVVSLAHSSAVAGEWHQAEWVVGQALGKSRSSKRSRALGCQVRFKKSVGQ
jgi:hypothetical protein